MRRISTGAAIGLFVLAGVVATVGFVEDAGIQDAPTRSECVDDWNAHAGAVSHRLIATNDYLSATVRGWFHDWAGCGISFRTRGAHPFLLHTCTRSFSTSDPAGTDWTCERDDLAWSTSGSAGPVEVGAGGLLSLGS